MQYWGGSLSFDRKAEPFFTCNQGLVAVFRGWWGPAARIIWGLQERWIPVSLLSSVVMIAAPGCEIPRQNAGKRWGTTEVIGSISTGSFREEIPHLNLQPPLATIQPLLVKIHSTTRPKTTIVHISLLHRGALPSLATRLCGARPYREHAHPANKCVTHCTGQIDGDVFGCQGTSLNGIKHGRGENKGEGTQQICNSAAVTVNWDNPLANTSNNAGDTASCTLNKNFRGGECEMDT